MAESVFFGAGPYLWRAQWKDGGEGRTSGFA